MKEPNPNQKTSRKKQGRSQKKKDPITEEVTGIFEELTTPNSYKPQSGISINHLAENPQPMVTEETVSLPRCRGKAMFL